MYSNQKYGKEYELELNELAVKGLKPTLTYMGYEQKVYGLKREIAQLLYREIENMIDIEVSQLSTSTGKRLFTRYIKNGYDQLHNRITSYIGDVYGYGHLVNGIADSLLSSYRIQPQLTPSITPSILEGEVHRELTTGTLRGGIRQYFKEWDSYHQQYVQELKELLKVLPPSSTQDKVLHDIYKGVGSGNHAKKAIVLTELLKRNGVLMGQTIVDDNVTTTQENTPLELFVGYVKKRRAKAKRLGEEHASRTELLLKHTAMLQEVDTSLSQILSIKSVSYKGINMLSIQTKEGRTYFMTSDVFYSVTENKLLYVVNSSSTLQEFEEYVKRMSEDKKVKMKLISLLQGRIKYGMTHMT